ncbi:MAG: response regulator [Veillonellaceae bacterium]|nr:response regulator [Veillonellaceae bacterium]
MHTRSILLVDDEKQILKALQRVFLETDYEVFTANSGEEALEIMCREKVDLIISDMRMPNMDGHELLKRTKQLYPTTIRIILSGYAEESQIFKSLLDGSSKMYLLKPWDNDQLLEVVKHMFESQSILQQAKLLNTINNMKGLSTLGKIYNRLIELIDTEADMKDIAALIESDPAIAARVLSLVNSAFYGKNTGSIRQAIVYLGLHIVKDIVLTVSIMESASSPSLSYNRQLLWKHAGLTNKYLILIYEKLLKKKIPDSCAAAGLLHDIGKVFLLSQYPCEFLDISNKLTVDKTSDFLQKEKQVIGVTHQELGGYLLNWWDIPYPIVEAALFHHNPAANPIVNRELVCAVNIADHFSWKSLNKQNNAEINEFALKFLDISQEECRLLLVE